MYHLREQLMIRYNIPPFDCIFSVDHPRMDYHYSRFFFFFVIVLAKSLFYYGPNRGPFLVDFFFFCFQYFIRVWCNRKVCKEGL